MGRNRARIKDHRRKNRSRVAFNLRHAEHVYLLARVAGAAQRSPRSTDNQNER